jgi:protein-L-isoaspartate(D-aspartate) O-methyltransferase
MKSINPHIAPRNRMVLDQLLGRGIHDAKVLDAMRKVAREAFVPEHLCNVAYTDRPLPIGEGQTISQPYMVASMTEALGLQGGEKVLEIGTGSGYSAAVLAHIAREVHTVERIANLAERARATLRRLGYNTVHVAEGDGTLGLPGDAPYDAIVVTAEGPRIPPSLRAQLKPGGRLVMPLSENELEQILVRLVRSSNHNETLERLYPVRFVPLVGVEGWSPAQRSPIDPLRHNGATHMGG